MARALGRYELLRPLARGGMAEVYLARRRAAGVEKWLVVKRMRQERTGDPRFLDLFVREARLSMSLVHQNIVPVFDFGRIDDQVFLAMERVEGRDLGSSLARAPGHRLPPLLAAFVAAECCQALDYAHQRKGPDGVALGVVHRDVTPRNVLLSWSGEVKLTDFGIAALAGEATSRLLGTPQYMAPEQARSEPIDPRADIYAIGLVLREAISGVRPRPGTDRDSILDAARRGVLLPWSGSADPPAADTELALGSGDHTEPTAPDDAPPAGLVAVIDRATAHSAADRYPDARSMLEELDAFIVAERAARKAESPARQLAAWLASVWEGARDDVEADAAIEADHLVSFLDDGAVDVLGTGTMRSLAMTAAEDGDATKAVLLPSAALSAGTPPVVASQAVLPPAERAAGVARSSRVSSSTSTVASGSFHTIPAPNDLAPAPRTPDRPRWAARLAGVAVVAVTAAGGARWFANRSEAPPRNVAGLSEAGSPAEHVATAQPGTGPGTAQPGPAQPGPAQPATEPPNTAQADSSQPHTPPTTTARGTGPVATKSGTGPPALGHVVDANRPRDAGLRTGSTAPGPGSGRAVTGPRAGLHPEHATIAPETGATAGGSSGHGSDSASADAATGSASLVGSAPARVTCRVRFNLTPWAYYTTDEDSTRRETPGLIDLTPGPHRLHVWNPELHVERDIVIHVPADRDTMNYSEPLQPTSLAPDAGSR
jgi:tRNA A-37 threonylcarbamoyl transferase component Bud32